MSRIVQILTFVVLFLFPATAAVAQTSTCPKAHITSLNFGTNLAVVKGVPKGVSPYVFSVNGEALKVFGDKMDEHFPTGKKDRYLVVIVGSCPSNEEPSLTGSRKTRITVPHLAYESGELRLYAPNNFGIYTGFG